MNDQDTEVATIPLDLGGFLEYLRLGGYAPRTVDEYRKDLTRLAGGAAGAGAAGAGTSIRREAVDALLAADGPGAARGRYALRTYRAWAEGVGLVARGSLSLRRPPKPRATPGERRALRRHRGRFLTEVEVRRFCDALNRTERDPCRHAAMSLMAACGLRVAEAVALPRGVAVELARRGAVVITGKGGHERAISAPDKWVVDSLRRAIGVAGWDTLGDGVAPRTARLGPVAKAKRQTEVLRRLAREVGRAAGLPGLVHPHDLRRTFGQYIWEQTGDLRTAQIALGHASSETTLLYTHAAPGVVARVVAGRFATGGAAGGAGK